VKVVSCSFCSKSFPCNDIVVAMYGHLYHPWCVVVHFGWENLCADKSCKGCISLDWLKSFGIREFDEDMYKQEVLDHYKEDQKDESAKQRAEAMVHYMGCDEAAFLAIEAQVLLIQVVELRGAL
jgi:hypothetical protein